MSALSDRLFEMAEEETGDAAIALARFALIESVDMIEPLNHVLGEMILSADKIAEGEVKRD